MRRARESRGWNRAAAAAIAAFLAACGGGSSVTDDAAAPQPDAGKGADAARHDGPVADAPRTDARDGRAPVDGPAPRPDAAPDAHADADRDGAFRDAAAETAAPLTDAGRDGGQSPRDTGLDSPHAPGDAPPAVLSPASPCTDAEGEVYVAHQGLPAMTDARRGDIVACTSDGTSVVSDVQSQLTAEGDTGVTALTGVSIYRVQYRTTRGDGSAAVSSARIYLPLVSVGATPPVIVAAHGTEGLAASCATSMDDTSMRDLALPWAALGYPVIAPDYAGLGTPGVQGYTDNRDTARSVVDAVAALRKFVSSTLSQQVVIDGHSQGGGAALATQALATSMGLQGELAAVVAFAPEYYSHLDSLGYVGALKAAAATNPLTISTGVTKCEVAALIEYAYFANDVPSGPPTAGFPASNAASLQNSIESLCTIPLGGAIQAEAVHVSDWTDPTLRAELLACVTGVSTAGADGGAACTGAGQAFYQHLLQNIVAPDSHGAPILLVQGLKDIVMPADQEAACNVAVLEAGGVTPQVCTDATASHTNVTSRNIGFGISWARAVLAGASLPACAASDLPACSAP